MTEVTALFWDVERFGLRRCFAVFFSSCFLGLTKPDPEVLREALLRSPEHLRDAFRRLGLDLSRTKRSPRAVAHRPRRVNHG